MSLADIRLRIFTFPQGWDGAEIPLRILVAPFGNPLQPLDPGLKPFAQAQLALSAHLIPSARPASAPRRRHGAHSARRQYSAEHRAGLYRSRGPVQRRSHGACGIRSSHQDTIPQDADAELSGSVGLCSPRVRSSPSPTTGTSARWSTGRVPTSARPSPRRRRSGMPCSQWPSASPCSPSDSV